MRKAARIRIGLCQRSTTSIYGITAELVTTTIRTAIIIIIILILLFLPCSIIPFVTGQLG